MPTMQDQEDPLTSKMETVSKSESKGKSANQKKEKTKKSIPQIQEIFIDETNNNSNQDLHIVDSQIFNKEQSSSTMQKLSREAIPLNKDLQEITDAAIV